MERLLLPGSRGAGSRAASGKAAVAPDNRAREKRSRSRPFLAAPAFRVVPGLVIALVTGLFPGAAPPAGAQEAASASVARSTIGVEDHLELTVSVPEVRGGGPELPRLDGFEVVGRRQMSSTSIVNLSMTRSIEWIFTLRPTGPGSFEIPPIAVPGY